MQTNPIFANKIMVLLQLLALDSRHHHWRTLGSLPYSLDLFAKIPNKNLDFVGRDMYFWYPFLDLRPTIPC